MKAIILPGKAGGTATAPPSKSMAHRMLIGAGLSAGTSVIKNIDLSEDIRATLGILEALGCRYSIEEDVVKMQGIGEKPIGAGRVLNVKESGSTLRFFIPILLCGGRRCRFAGAKSLFARPLGIYEEICKEQGILFQKTDDSLELEGKLRPAHYRVPGNISSQFITGLLYALPMLEADSSLEVLAPVESRAYIEMTLEALAFFGIRIERDGDCFRIPGGQTFQAADGVVEGDYSNAAFLEAFNLIGGDVQVEGLKAESLQGDQIYRSYFPMLCGGCPTLDLSGCPDLGPVLISVAAAKHGAVFTGTRRLKIKESDRGRAMADELKKFGIAADVEADRIVVHPGKLKKPEETLDSHNDHRIAMALALLCTLTGGTIDGCMAVRKSFPGYYDTLRKLGIRVTIQD